MFVAIPEKFKNIMKDVSPGYWRLQAFITTCNETRLLLFNSYLSVDTQSVNYDETELLETLNYVKNIIQENDHDQILWAGDLNTDFARTTKHTRIVNDFIEEHCLDIAFN